VLGLFDATAMVVGSIIGSGIFLKVGNVDKALMAWGFLPIISVWIFVGLVTLCGSLALAELAAMYPHAGGPYLYLREAYGRLPAFLWAWTEFWVIRTGSLGALACASAIYLDEFLQRPDHTGGLGHWGQLATVVTIIVGLTIINMISTRWGASVQNVATVAKIGFLAMLITLPVVMQQINTDHLHPLWNPTPAITAQPDASTVISETSTHRSLLAALGVALIAVFWPYDGWINIGPVAEEIREPRVNVPRALAMGVAIVVLVYVTANVSYHLVMPMSELAQSTRPAADVFRVLFGSWGAKLAAFGVFCSTFGAANSNLIAGPRIYFAASRDGLVPGFLHRVDPRFNTPLNSVLIQGIYTTILAVAFYGFNKNPKAVFDLITDAVICAGLIFYSLTVAAVFVLRRHHPDVERPYKTWGYPFTPALMIISYAFAFVWTLIEQFNYLVWVLALIASGVVYYMIVTRRAERPDDRHA
jgi:APA family basic amino acid/polyamine antiporter